MRAVLQLRLSNQEGALLRVLGCLRRRGYEVVRLVANRTEHDASLDLVMIVESERSMEVLVRQLRKFIDVLHAHLSESPLPAVAAPHAVPVAQRKEWRVARAWQAGSQPLARAAAKP